jgi:thymidylate synthase
MQNLIKPSKSIFINNVFKNPLGMYNFICELTRTVRDNKNKIRNFCGVIEEMDNNSIVIETELFNKEVLDFYSMHNMSKLDKIKDDEMYKKYYNQQRGGDMGDYSSFFEEKYQNVLDSLRKFPNSKRAIITMPYSDKKSYEVLHSNDAEQKCLRELHFYIEDDLLFCTGFMRAQAAIIFPKNIHFIGSVFNRLAEDLGISLGTYTHFVTCLVYDRE